MKSGLFYWLRIRRRKEKKKKNQKRKRKSIGVTLSFSQRKQVKGIRIPALTTFHVLARLTVNVSSFRVYAKKLLLVTAFCKHKLKDYLLRICFMINLTVLSSNEYEKIKKEKAFVISYGYHSSPFGKCLIGLYRTNICHLSFVINAESENLNILKRQWPGAVLVCEKKKTDVIDKIFHSEELFEVLLKGTVFESKVWKGMLEIPRGETISYGGLASKIGSPKSVRAVANAVAKNSVCYLIPCHRVIRNDGSIHKYRWGSDIKKKILQFEEVCINEKDNKLDKFDKT